MTDRYGLAVTPEQAGKIKQIIQRYPDVDDEGDDTTLERPILTVRVTGAVSGGWYPAIVTDEYGDGTWIDYQVCEVAGYNDEDLYSGIRYLARRHGKSGSGVPRFRAAAFCKDITAITGVSGVQSGCSITLTFARKKYKCDGTIETLSSVEIGFGIPVVGVTVPDYPIVFDPDTCNITSGSQIIAAVDCSTPP